MRTQEPASTYTDVTPATASTTAISSTILFKGGKASVFARSEYVVIDAVITTGAGGTLDVYIQKRIGVNSWEDWAHFPQVSASTTKRFTCATTGWGPAGANSFYDCGGGTDATPTPSLPANTFVNTIPTNDLRAVFVTGAGVSGAGSVSITLTPFSESN